MCLSYLDELADEAELVGKKKYFTLDDKGFKEIECADELVSICLQNELNRESDIYVKVIDSGSETAHVDGERVIEDLEGLFDCGFEDFEEWTENDTENNVVRPKNEDINLLENEIGLDINTGNRDESSDMGKDDLLDSEDNLDSILGSEGDKSNKEDEHTQFPVFNAEETYDPGFALGMLF
ncbi:hypothetical protein Salat_0805700 [Sesamum alatum]|uniref:Uncharacterized protein n=1 Tax=Sesamum alatum TaxID=300844 RepID=A0AAE1YTX9_9LAMI|nr:hypothetical protein Salat_0805700 [Sesamum alatum]